MANEIWKYGGERVKEWSWRFCNRVWKGEGWPEKWKDGVVVPILKKGEGDVVGDYRGVTLMPTAYKIYAAVLAERIKEEIEREEKIPHNQTGFRKGMGTMDSVYVLNYLVNKRIEGKRGGMVALFVDLKAAFDSVDREILGRAMRERGIREGLVKRVEELTRETKSRIRMGEECGREFWTARGIRQGCPLSPILFNILIADLEEKMKKGRWGGVELGEEKVYTLAYADDVVLLAKEEGEMRSMMGKLEGYLEEKGLTLNVNKTKIMRFRKGGGRWRKVDWRWRGGRIEEVKEFTYLGYVMQRNGGQEAHIRERVRRAAAVMGQVWGIGKRKFGSEWGKRLWLFDRLVWTVASYGVEIWGWKERERVEKLEERYLRWVLGVEGRTPGYLVREELQRDKLEGRAGRRALGFEKRLEEGKGSKLARKCMREWRERWRKGKIREGWEEERKDFFERRGMGVEEMERRREEEEGGGEWEREWERGERERQRRERWEKIRESRYNRWYREIKGEGIPGYLKKGWGESRWRRVARFRLGSEVRESRYWEEEEERTCRMCGREVESWEHVWERCRSWGEEGGGSWQGEVRRVLGEDGEGEWWMRMVERERREGEEGRREKGEDGV